VTALEKSFGQELLVEIIHAQIAEVREKLNAFSARVLAFFIHLIKKRKSNRNKRQKQETKNEKRCQLFGISFLLSFFYIIINKLN
jgi:hypothetical protein